MLSAVFLEEEEEVERKKGGGDGGEGARASVSQTCSNNELYYLQLFAVSCNQAAAGSSARAQRSATPFSLAASVL